MGDRSRKATAGENSMTTIGTNAHAMFRLLLGLSSRNILLIIVSLQTTVKQDAPAQRMNSPAGGREARNERSRRRWVQRRVWRIVVTIRPELLREQFFHSWPSTICGCLHSH